MFDVCKFLNGVTGDHVDVSSGASSDPCLMVIVECVLGDHVCCVLLNMCATWSYLMGASGVAGPLPGAHVSCVCCQVFRIPAGGMDPDLTLGERFVHSDDAAHFCKPTDVAVMASGDFFVSDG